MKLSFTKIVGSGNDFVIIDCRKTLIRGLSVLARKICDRKYGIGADGLLVLERSRKADVRMRIFNADGSEAEMCGNGARCLAYYLGKSHTSLDTRAGTIKTEVKDGVIKIKLTAPKNIKLDIPVRLNRALKVNFINTGVPHTVIFVQGLNNIDVSNLGRALRFHKKFAPSGTNVNFVEVVNNNTIRVRTYERGVEDETLACGTGSVASALIFGIKTKVNNKIKVITASGETLNVYFNRLNDRFTDVWLEGRVKLVYKGVYNV